MTPTNRQDIQNPYTPENRSEYRMGKIEKILHDTFGFRTNYDAYQEQMNNAQQEWETQNQSLGYEENYNSAAEQAARLKDAGLNPDLNKMEAGNASEMAEPESHMISPGGMDLEAIETGGEWAAKLASMALDMATGSAGLFTGITGGIMNIKKGINELDTQEVELGKALRQMADESYGEFEDLVGKTSIPGQAEWMGKAYGGGGKFLAKMKGLKGRNAEKFAAMYNGMVNSATAKMKEAEKKGGVNIALSKPEVALPEIYREVQQNLIKHSAKVVENELWKAKEYGKILQNNPELFQGMSIAQMQDVINKAVTSGNEAEISKYKKAIAEKDKVDRELRQRQNNADWEYLYQFWNMDWGSRNNAEYVKAYGDVMRRLYGQERTAEHFPLGMSIQ